jgi:hypothetical protein
MKTILIIVSVLAFHLVLGQTMDEVIEGPRLKNGEIYLNHQLDVSFLQEKLIRYRKFSDSTIISIKGNGLTGKKRAYRVFIKAYNPLHYSTDISSKMVVDSINLELDMAYDELTQTLSSQKSKSVGTESTITTISRECIILMGELVQLDFIDKKNTIENIKTIGTDFLEIKKRQEAAIEMYKKDKEIYKRKNDEYKDIYQKHKDSSMTDSLKQYYHKALFEIVNLKYETDVHVDLIKIQTKLISNVEKLLKKITEAMIQWKYQYEHKGEWFIQIEEGMVSRKKMAVVVMKMIKHTVEIDKNGSIIQGENKVITEKIIRFRKYSLFIPEVAVGLIYTNQEFPTYTTKENSQGENTVGLINEKPLEKIVVSTLINFNVNIRNSPVLPFLQLGAGYSGKLPIGLIGGGLRFDFGENKNLALSSGISFTGIKDLNTLSEGEVVKDEAEIKGDLKYQFSGPKLYFGIQYNF